MKEKRTKTRKAIAISDGAESGEDNSSVDSVDETKSAMALSQKARSLWLQHATNRQDLDIVEDLYRRALNAKKQVLAMATVHKTKKKHKKRKREGSSSLVRKTVAALSPEEYRKAGERLSLLYLQSGRPYKATMGLKYLGFECRLSEKILNYPTTSNFSSPNDDHKKKLKKKKHQKSGNNSNESSQLQPPCCVVDNFLSQIELHHLRKVFGDVRSTYWTTHNYIIDKEPPAPYFSYVIDLKKQQEERDHLSKNKHNQKSFVRRIIDKILRSSDVADQFPSLRRDAKYVEMWAHNRPHASGHQLHFDSDDEGRSRQEGGFPNHPICSCVLNVSSHSRVGGPTLVTNQRLRNPTTTHLKSVRGWLVPSRPSRLVCFDGSVLHGVVPGKGVIPAPQDEEEPRPRRVTLMMAFWKEIRVRPSKQPGSARPWPLPFASSKLPAWADELNRIDVYSKGSSNLLSQSKEDNDYSSPQTQIIPVPRVYELLDGTPVPKYHENSDGEGYYMPEYDKVFQGF